MADTALEDTDRPSVSSYRRIWKKRTGSEGSSQIVLAVYGILYDAGQPLTRDDIADRLIARLDPYQRAYLETWYLRVCERQEIQKQRKRPLGIRVNESTRMSTPLDVPDIRRAVRHWLSKTLSDRLRTTQSLIRDADGRYRPGAKPPRILTIDGRLLAFTPAMRQELEQTDHDAGRGYLALLEWSKLIADPAFQTAEARVQLLWLVGRRLVIGEKKTGAPLDERHVGPRLKYLLGLPDTPGVKRVLLERILADLLAVLDPQLSK